MTGKLFSSTRVQIVVFGLIAIAILLTLWWRKSPYYHEVRSAITFVKVDAPCQNVNAVLTDFTKYPEWNPYVVRAERKDSNSQIPFTMTVVESSGTSSRSHRVKVTRWQNDGFTWEGSTWPSWLLSWTESFETEAAGDHQCELLVTQRYQGLLLRSYWNYMNPKYLSSVNRMGSELKKRVAH